MSKSRRKLPGRIVNAELSESVGREVVEIEAVPIVAGQVVRLKFESAESPWRQGVRLVTDGVLMANEVEAPQLDFWIDTAPDRFDVACLSTDGLLRFYNIWESGRFPGMESRSHTSGMIVDDFEDGSRRYSCNDIGFNPSFNKLVFSMTFQ